MAQQLHSVLLCLVQGKERESMMLVAFNDMIDYYTPPKFIVVYL
ncbi:hypothetical protein [Thaumasiovibrio subtropicus]|nr:hypothetical protein [Thaumasiovibrio subtropicus]